MCSWKRNLILFFARFVKHGLMVKQFRQIFIQKYFQYFEHIEETEWAIEECLKSNLPVRKKETYDTLATILSLLKVWL